LIDRNQLWSDFSALGFGVVPEILDTTQCQAVVTDLRQWEGSRTGSRASLTQAWCRSLARSVKTHPMLAHVLPTNAVAVQCTLFEKTPRNNWLVSLHQDLSIPVRERVQSCELSGWSVKGGVVFVQPPTSVLESLVAVRVHLDEAGREAGALRIVPGSHELGRLDAVRASTLRAERGEVVPEVPRGGVLVMRPLLLHASSKATVPVLRRVLHFLYGPPCLPAGLIWNEAV
jgi:ectoine hydroxylase-related dioxygenase (phytanoyl-CoA dioxygenase family)